MPHTPHFSVVTPTYDRQQALIRAVRSVQAQTFADYEHIVVDDGSRDGTAKALREICDGRIRYEPLTFHQGANVARNHGIQIARSEWITFLDSDDEYLPHRLQHLLDAIVEYPETHLFISSFQLIKHDRITTCANHHGYLDGLQFERALMAYDARIAGTSISVRRDLIQRVGGFAPRLSRLQDRQLLLAISRVSGARFLADVDWLKHYSADSISEQRQGYIEAMDDLLDFHPDLVERYRRLVGYHVARRIAKKCLQADLASAASEWRANKVSRHLNYGLWELCRDYFHGKNVRRSLSESSDHSRSTTVVLPLNANRRSRVAS